MRLALSYRALSGAIRQSDRLYNELNQYSSDLNRKVQNKLYSVDGGLSNYLQSADYYVNRKLNNLNQKKQNIRNVNVKTKHLLETAKRVDREVKNVIGAKQRSFFKNHPELKPSELKRHWRNFICNAKNRSKTLNKVIGAFQKMGEVKNNLKDEIKYWWEVEGGKELVTNIVDIGVKAALAAVEVAMAVKAVITAVAAIVAIATGGAVLAAVGLVVVAVAAVTCAVIAVADACNNFDTSIKAIQTRNSNPAMSVIYSDQDTLVDRLKETDYGTREKNRKSNRWANGIAITDAVAGVIVIANDVREGVAALKKGYISLFTVQNRDKLGRFAKGKHFEKPKSIRDGLHTLKKSYKRGFKNLFFERNRNALGQYAKGSHLTFKKFLKNMLQGDIALSDNFKTAKGLTILQEIEGYEKIVDITKAGIETVDAANDVLKGDRSVGEFFAKRGMKGVFRNIESIDKNSLFNKGKKIFEKTGLPKALFENLDSSGGFDYVMDPSEGFMQKIESGIEALKYKSFNYRDAIPAGGGGGGTF